MSLKQSIVAFITVLSLTLLGCANTQSQEDLINITPRELVWKNSIHFNDREDINSDRMWYNAVHTIKEPIQYDIPAGTTDIIEYVENDINSKITWTDLHYNDRYQRPQELMTMRAGVCSAYAIAKYYILKEHGIPVDDMYLMILRFKDQKPDDRVDHMILFVKYQGKEYFLDNIKNVSDEWKRENYVPLELFNEKYVWYRADDPKL